MIRKLTAAAFLLFAALTAAALPASAEQSAAQWSATIETDNGAVLISGPRDSVIGIRDSLPAKCPECSTIEQVAEYIRSNSPATIELRLFRESDLPLGAEVSHLNMTLRRAILLGLVPPVEGLGRDDARELLSAAGIAMFSPVEWAGMDLSARVALASSASREIIVAENFSSQSSIELIFAGKRGVK